MARIQVRVRGRNSVGELTRIPVKGDYIPTSNSTLEVTQVFLFAPNSRFDAVVVAEPAQQGLLTDTPDGVLHLEDEETVG